MTYDVNTKEGRRDLVFSVWPALAAWAYRLYLAKGRGAVVIPAAPEGPGEPKWLTQAPADAHDLANLIASYDPEDEIVVIFEFYDGTQRIAFGHYGVDDCPPPMAYAVFMNR